jgi:hypothetical protein
LSTRSISDPPRPSIPPLSFIVSVQARSATPLNSG